ncbi:MAG: PDZ domain-containing protein [Candidatus Omnitrophota bacterium]
MNDYQKRRLHYSKTYFGIFLLIVLTLFSIVLVPAVCRAASLTDSVVKVFATKNPIDFHRPWQTVGSQSGTGSGFVIEGDLILTNAHVVSDHTFIQVRKQSSPKKYVAQLEALGNDCDLALLSVQDKSFFEDTIPIPMGDIPQLQEAVTVIGFPLGGDKLSITEGVVSRIEVVPYAHSANHLLAIQIDAAINPGNSGGPVVKDGKLVGVAMQAISQSQNIGFMIPMPVIQHFLEDIQDERYDGFPVMGIEYDNTENPALRDYYHLPGNAEGGVVVTQIMPFSSAEGVLQEGDIISAVEGTEVGLDGSFKFRPGQTLTFSHLIHQKFIGEEVSMTIWREGRKQSITMPLQQFRKLVPSPDKIEKPSYLVYGGMVFTTLTTDLLKTWGQHWWKKAPFDFLYYLIGRGRFNPDRKKDIVVLLDVLPDDINVGYFGSSKAVIKSVNGKSFDSFEEFVKLLQPGLGKYVIFETIDGFRLVLNREAVFKKNDQILRRNNIQEPASADALKILPDLTD